MLSVENIDLFYGASHALRSVSLQAETGQVTAVLGRNGVGKTSLMRAVVGQHPVSGGDIVWEGKKISRDPAWKRSAAGIAIVPQGREIFPLLTVKENLETGFAALAIDTDGIDGSEDNAGAIMDGDSWQKAQDQNIDLADYLDRNDAYSAFEKLDDLIVTGPTLTNVNDFRAILIF